MTIFRAIMYLAGLAAVSLQPACAEPPAEIADLSVPPGFRIEVAVADIPNARSMVMGQDGTLFVSTRKLGKVYAVTGLGSTDVPTVTVIAEGLNMPNGVAFRDGALYVAEISRVLVFRNIMATMTQSPSPEVLDIELPGERHHGWRYIAFGPDGRLYIGIGAP